MRQTMESEKTGKCWSERNTLGDVDFSSGLCLMSHNLEDSQAKTKKL